MKERKHQGKKGNFVYMSVGMGKTVVALTFLSWLIESGQAPTYVIYTTPKSAITTLIKEIEYFGKGLVHLCLPTAGWKSNARAKYTTEKDHATLLAGKINIIEHDHLRFMEEELLQKATSSLLIVDEVHKTLNDTKRTGIALELAKLSQEFVVMSGTPTVDSNLYKIINWLELLNEFFVTEKNFWAAANGMISRVVQTGVDVITQNTKVPMTDGQMKQYLELMPAGLGGTNSNPSAKQFQQAFGLCYEACTPEMVALSVRHIRKGEGVMLVARNQTHQDELASGLMREGVELGEILLLGKDQSIFMTREAVDSGEVPNYKAVITTIRLAEGYTLSHFHIMVTCVYPSAQSTREQLVGRLNRLSQLSKSITVYVTHCGILSYVLEQHEDASSISKIIESLADKVF